MKTTVEKAGVLWKRPFMHASARWSRRSTCIFTSCDDVSRFFILKDSFLLYYAEKEAAAFADTGMFNIHPKGVIPLSEAWIELDEETKGDAGRLFGIVIKHHGFGGLFIQLAAESTEEQKRWLAALQQGTRMYVGDVLTVSLRFRSFVLIFC